MCSVSRVVRVNALLHSFQEFHSKNHSILLEQENRASYTDLGMTITLKTAKKYRLPRSKTELPKI